MNTKKGVRKPQNEYDKWCKMRKEMREADVNRKSLIRSIADLFHKVLPVTTQVSRHTSTPPPSLDTQLLSTSRDTPDPSPDEIEEGEDVGNVEDNYVETEEQDFGNKYFGKIASPYVTSYLYKRPFLDKEFRILKDADGQFRIGKSPIEIDQNRDVFVEGKTYSGTPGLFELLKRRKINKSLITTHHLKNYRRILEATNANRQHNKRANVIKATRGVKFREVITHLFPGTTKRGSRRHYDERGFDIKEWE